MSSYSFPGDQSAADLMAVRQIAAKTGPWMRFLAVGLIFLGVLSIFTIIAIPVSVWFIWMGIVLYQSAERAARAAAGGSMAEFAEMIVKIRSFFVMATTLAIFTVAFIIAGWWFASAYLKDVIRQLLILL